MPKNTNEPVRTTPSHMKLGPDVLSKLDELVTAFGAESGDPQSRSSVVRQLIHREHARRKKRTTE